MADLKISELPLSPLTLSTGALFAVVEGGVTYKSALSNVISSLPTADGSTKGLLTSTDWNTFNNKISANQSITLSNDLSGTGTTSISATISSGAVTLLKMAPLAANSFIGNNTGASATPIALTKAQATALLNVFSPTLQGVVPPSGGGSTNFLCADGTWTTPSSGPTVTGITTLNTLTAGSQNFAVASTGNDFAISSAVGTHTFSIPNAAGAGVTRGLLTATDWNTFNNKVSTSVTISTTSPLLGGGDLSANRTLSIQDADANGTTKGAATFSASDFNASSGLISIDYANGQAASSSTKGFLTSADWNTFNNKQNTLTNPITGTGVTNEIAYFTGTTTIGSLNTGTYPTLTELSYVRGVTSSIQTQLDTKISGNQTITLSGNVTGSGTTAITTTIAAFAVQTGMIAASAVTLPKLAAQASNTIIGNITGGSASPTALTATQVTSMLNVFTSTLKGLVPGGSNGSTTVFLRGDGQWQTPAFTGVNSISFGSTGLTPSTATTGAVTVGGTLSVSNGGTGATSLTGVLIGSGTNSIVGVAAALGDQILKRNSTNTAYEFFTPNYITSITLTGDLSGSGGSSINATINNSAVTYAKIQNISAGSRLLGRGNSSSGVVEEITLGSGLSMVGTVLSVTGGPGGGVSSIGTIDGVGKSSDGAVISGGTSLVMQTADVTYPGLVSTTTQTFAGNKTFRGASATIGTALQVENSAQTLVLGVANQGGIQISQNTAITGKTVATISATGNGDVSLVLNPTGNGALMGRSSGDARGLQAVDWQLGGTSATMVAAAFFSTLSGGTDNTVTEEGAYASIGGGYQNIVASEYSTISGGVGARTSIYGQRTNASGFFSTASDAQSSVVTVRRSSTGGTGFVLTADGQSPSGLVNNIYLYPPTGTNAARVWNVRVDFIATVVDTGAVAGLARFDSFSGNYTLTIRRTPTVNAAIVGSIITSGEMYDTSMTTSTVSITANTTDGALQIQFNPPTVTGTNTVIRAVATVYLTEVAYSE